VLTYDEHGGFFDHVSPPKTVDDRAAQGFDQLGFRVPTMVIGPYVKKGYVSSMTYEHVSALRHIEKTFNLDSLNQRSAAATDLSDFLDMDRLAKNDPAPPIQIPMVDPTDTTQWPMGAVCFTGSVRESHPILEWADTHPAALAGGLDLRSETDEYRRTIREFLAENRGELVK